jgi:hypothetical protein
MKSVVVSPRRPRRCPIAGYVSAEFDLKSGSAAVKGDVDTQAVVNALTKAGYPADVEEG